ncbi:MAG: hypothetical protein SO013_02280 [Prevotella sp.]|nr:hypothetical protein [Prevotella sp.]
MKKILRTTLAAAVVALGLLVPQQANAQWKWPGKDMWTYAYKGAGVFNGTVTNNNTMYLYNVAAGEEPNNVNVYLNSFGNWGVEATLHEVGTPLHFEYLTYGGKGISYRMLTSPSKETTAKNKIAWVYGQGKVDDNGLMCDRMTQTEEGYKGLTCWSDWWFNRVSSDPDYRYVIYYKDWNGNYWFMTRQKGASGLHKDVVVCKQMAWNDAIADKNCHWLMLTRQEMINQFNKDAETVVTSYTDPVDATFYLWDPHFKRNDGNQKKWQITDNVKIANNRYYDWGVTTEPSNHQINFTERPFERELTSNTDKASVPYNSLYGMFYNAEMKGKTGDITQETDAVDSEGYYMITVQGFYKPGDGSQQRNAKLYATAVNPHNSDQIQIITNPLPLHSSLDNPPTDLTSAGMRFYQDHENYSTKVILKVKKGDKIRFGVKLENGTSDDDWVAIDNFQMKYLGGQYLISQAFGSKEQYWQKQNFKTLILIRDFNIGKWNSFCLPLNLNKDQVVTAFGNDVKLAKLKGLSADGLTIEFETVNLDAMRWTDEAIRKNEPYLILPHVGGRRYDIVWDDFFDNDGQKQITAGPNYVIPLTHFDPNVVSEKAEEFVNMKGQIVKIHPIQFFHTKLNSNPEAQQIQASKDTYVYAMYKGNLRRMTNNFNMVGLTFYINYGENAPSGAKLMNVIDENNNSTTTGIETISASSIDADKKSKGIYAVGGEKVSEQTDTHGLPAGIYVVDGKKVMVY